MTIHLSAFLSANWNEIAALGLMLWSAPLLVLGLIGNRSGRYGLARRGVSIQGRVAGWRMIAFGLTLLGAGIGWFWGITWLLVMALGFGFAEVNEANQMLRAWRLMDDPPHRPAPRATLPSAT